MSNQNTNIAYLIPLKQIVFEYLDESMQSRDQYRRMFPIAMRGIIDLGLDVFFSSKTCRIDIDSNMTAKLPDDYIQYIRIGVLNSNGEIATLIRNDNLSNYVDLAYDRTSRNVDNSVSSNFGMYQQFFYNYSFDMPIMNLFGVPGSGQPVGYYKIDTKNNVILLNNDYSYGYLILEYLSLPCDDDFKVPVQAREALLAWMAWRDVATKPLSSINPAVLARERKHEYIVQKDNARMRISTIDLSSLKDVYDKNVRLVVKA